MHTSGVWLTSPSTIRPQLSRQVTRGQNARSWWRSWSR